MGGRRAGVGVFEGWLVGDLSGWQGQDSSEGGGKEREEIRDMSC